MITAIDHVVAAVPDLQAAASAYERLGLALTPPTRHSGRGTENRVFFVGGAGNAVFFELLGIHDRALAAAAGLDHYLATADAGGGLARIVFRTDGLKAEVRRLRTPDFDPRIEEVRSGERIICAVAALDGIPDLSLSAGLVEYVEPQDQAYERRLRAGRFAHRFPLRRLDHVATIPADLEASTRCWSTVMGISPAGEARRPGWIIRQLRVGDAVVELIGADTPESPVARRPRGLISMVSWEVPDLEAAVALARERGFAASDPSEGILPGTRIATIPGAELAGVSLQLLEYVAPGQS